MRTWTRAAAAGALLSGALLAGCGDDDEAPTGDTTAAPGSSSPSTSDDAPAATGSESGPYTTTLEPADDRLADGPHFGYLVALELDRDGGATGRFDLAQLLTGQAAVDQAEAEGSTVDGDHYISNVNPRLREVSVRPDATVTEIGDGDACCEPTPSDLVTLTEELEPPRPVQLTVVGGVVTRIDEQYLP